MQKIGKNLKKIIFWALALIVALAAITLAWLYTGKFTVAKQKLFQIIPVPIAMVGNKTVLVRDYLARYKIVENFGRQNNGAVQTANKQAIFNGLLDEIKIYETAKKHGVSVNERELDAEYGRLSRTTDLKGQKDFNGYLETLGLNEENFKQSLLKPQIILYKLQAWFYGQEPLNQNTYASLRSIQDKLSAGESFESLAKIYSQDKGSAVLEGDLGFVSVADLLPELQEQVDAMGEQELKPIVSRYGLHLVKLDGRDSNGPQNAPRVHLKQIFLQGGDFEQWLNTEKQTIPAKIFFNPSN